MKRCLVSLIIRETQIKTTIRYHYIPVRKVIINKWTKKCWWGCREKGNILHFSWECSLVQPLWKTVWSFFRKLNMEFPYDSEVPLMGIYQKKTETLIWKTICTPMFIALLFTIAKIWKQPKCPSVDEWIEKQWNLYTMEYCLAIKKKSKNLTLCDSMNGPAEYYAKWNMSEKDKYRILLICGILNKVS